MSGGGFVMVPDWVRAKRPSGNAMLAYINLGSFGTFKPGSGTYEECRPSLARLADEMGVSESTAKRALAELVELGAAIRTTRNNEDGSSAPSVYRLVFGTVAEARGRGPRVNPRGFTGEPREGVTDEPTRGPRVNPNQEPSTKNPFTKNQAPIDAADASSSNGPAVEDDQHVQRSKKRRPTKAQQDRELAVDCIRSTSYEYTDEQIAVFLTYLRAQYGVRYVGAYCDQILHEDGEDKLADLIGDAWTIMRDPHGEAA